MPTPSNFETDHAVAELRSHPGYKWVVDQIQSELNGLENQLENSKEHEVDVSLLAQWKAHRKLVRRLRSMPEDCDKRARAQLTAK